MAPASRYHYEKLDASVSSEVSIGLDPTRGKTYVFWIRPAGSNVLPREWWLPGALGPLATIEASRDGLRIFRRSPAGTALQIGMGIAVGAVLLWGVWFWTVVFVARGLGVSVESAELGLAVATLLVFGILMATGPYVRKLSAWRPLGPFVPIHVQSVALRTFHQELRILGGPYDVAVYTRARRATITAALRLAHQMPPESEVSG